jgi:serine/threonine protein kinase
MTNKIGTFQWMAPEVITGTQYDEKADVYSFGIIIWEICHEKPPYKGQLKRTQRNRSLLTSCDERPQTKDRPKHPKRPLNTNATMLGKLTSIRSLKTGLPFKRSFESSSTYIQSYHKIP